MTERTERETPSTRKVRPSWASLPMFFDEAHRELGLSCLELDRLDCARESLTRFVELAPYSSKSRETRELLEQLRTADRDPLDPQNE